MNYYTKSPAAHKKDKYRQGFIDQIISISPSGPSCSPADPEVRLTTDAGLVMEYFPVNNLVLNVDVKLLQLRLQLENKQSLNSGLCPV